MQTIRAARRPRTRPLGAAALAAALLSFGAGLAFTAPTALASRGPRLSFTLPSTATAETTTSFTWSAASLPARDRLAVQRQEGTARVWRTILVLPHTAGGTAQLPGLPLGTYRLRLAVLGSRGRILSQEQHGLDVFGQVPFSTLLSQNGGGVFTTPSNTFRYVIEVTAYPGNTAPAITDDDNACRSVHFDFVASASGDLPGEAGVLTLVQQSLDPVSASAAGETFGSLDARLVPGQAWSVTATTSGGSGGLYIYANGYADCDSTSSLQQT